MKTSNRLHKFQRLFKRKAKLAVQYTVKFDIKKPEQEDFSSITGAVFVVCSIALYWFMTHK